MLLLDDPSHILSPCSMNYNNMEDEYFGSCVSSTVLKADHTHKSIKDICLIFFL